MENVESHIVVDNIKMKVYKIRENPDTFKVVSDSERFVDIFGTKSLKLQRDNKEMENFAVRQVVLYDQEKALKVLREIKKVM